MIIASHNTFSYLPVRNVCMLPFNIAAKCQRKTLSEQISLGVAYIDIRVRFDSYGNPYFCHGVVEYDCDVWSELKALQYTKITARVILETRKHDDRQEVLFRTFCSQLQDMFPCCYFYGGRRKYDWKPITPLKSTLESANIVEKYASSNGSAWYNLLDDLCPYLYALRNNKKNYQSIVDGTVLMLDFVDIGL